MSSVAIIFPHQLFRDHPALEHAEKVILLEDYLYFRVQNFHAKRLILLRASMKAYADYLEKNGHDVTYIPSTKLKKRGDCLDHIGKPKHVHIAEPSDEWLMRDLEKGKASWDLHVHDTPQFIFSLEELDDYLGNKKKLFMASFYKQIRKDLDILMESGKPRGGKFSYDAENRKPLPKEIDLPDCPFPKENDYVPAAVAYVRKNFPDAVGQQDPFFYPTTFKEADDWFEAFLKERFRDFGPYEDAIASDDSFLFHSVLSPMLNIGLLTPEDVVRRAVKYGGKHNVPIESIEGFVRQILGWREFMRGAYLLKAEDMRQNFFQHKRKLPQSFWDGTTGMPPIDITIKKVLKTGYAHHIERLMVLGNFMLLCEFDPDDVYEWFMEFFIDSYDWVMVPNVYAMSQFADGGTITTKPYVSSSNYLNKMGDYEKGEWCDVWDGLFWRFVKKHQTLFSQNPRTKAMLSNLERNKENIEKKIALGETFLKQL